MQNEQNLKMYCAKISRFTVIQITIIYRYIRPVFKEMLHFETPILLGSIVFFLKYSALVLFILRKEDIN